MGGDAGDSRPRAVRRWVTVCAGLLALTIAIFAAANFGGVQSALLSTLGDASTPTERGAIRFVGDDFGALSLKTLETHAVPWRLTAAALVLAERDRNPSRPISQATLRQIVSGFGFLFPDDIGNWPAGLAKVDSKLPLGLTYGTLAPAPFLKVESANLGCAACHAGVTYAPDGKPEPKRAWLGLPNTSLDLEAYTDAVYRAFLATAERPDALIETASTLFPEMDWRERLTIRYAIFPRVRERLAALSSIKRAAPFPNGSPGNTNGVAALKQALGIPLAEGGAGETGFTSIPDLGHRTWRTSLLYDGAYAVPGEVRTKPMTARQATPAHTRLLASIVTFFTVPSMGVHPDKAVSRIEGAVEVMTFLDRYRAPAFPGGRDWKLAAGGRDVYAANCASCHGTYDDSLERPQLVTFPNWLGEVGTDPVRANAFSAELAAAVDATTYRSAIAAQHTGAYAAPPLGGLWASAPYLHNGSVPTIRALLKPSLRPKRFLVGGHALDFVDLGVALAPDGTYPDNYAPWSTPVLTDVTTSGHGNAGHEFGATLPDADIDALIEYLKLL